MSTETMPLGFAPGNATAAATDPRPSFLERLFAGIVAGRLRQGEAHVASVLTRMSDRQLADLGLSRAAIAHVRATGKLPRNYWTATPGA